MSLRRPASHPGPVLDGPLGPETGPPEADPDIRRLEKFGAEVFPHFRRLEAVLGLRGRQKKIQDEKPVLGKLSGLPGTAH